MSGSMTEAERQAIERFPLAAREFCHLVDDFGSYERKRLIQELAVHLARLCEVAARLPIVEPATEGVDHTPEEIASHTEEWAKLLGSLRPVFGNLDIYWEVFDATQKEEPVAGSLADDIVDIYLDLKDALKLLKTGAALDDIHWHWRFDFRSHWSRHATSALRVMLQILDLP